MLYFQQYPAATRGRPSTLSSSNRFVNLLQLCFATDQFLCIEKTIHTSTEGIQIEGWFSFLLASKAVVKLCLWFFQKLIDQNLDRWEPQRNGGDADAAVCACTSSWVGCRQFWSWTSSIGHFTVGFLLAHAAGPFRTLVVLWYITHFKIMLCIFFSN